MVGALMDKTMLTSPQAGKARTTWRVLKAVGVTVGYALLLLAVFVLYNDDSPQFIYVAF